jgi:hypothetical protein
VILRLLAGRKGEENSGQDHAHNHCPSLIDGRR